MIARFLVRLILDLTAAFVAYVAASLFVLFWINSVDRKANDAEVRNLLANWAGRPVDSP
jgi:hypothetical protein